MVRWVRWAYLSGSFVCRGLTSPALLRFHFPLVEPDWQPSPYFRQVGFRDHLFEESMTFMGITACSLGESL